MTAKSKKKNTEANTDVNTPVANVNIDETTPNSSENIAVTSENIANSNETTPNTDTQEPAFTHDLQANATNAASKQLSLRVKETDFEWWDKFKSEYETASEAFTALVLLAEKKPETIEVEKNIEITKEVPIKLSPVQAIVTFGKETADKIRLCRPFIAQGNVLNYEKGNDESFISELVNLSVNKTLERNFPGIIRRLNNKSNS